METLLLGVERREAGGRHKARDLRRANRIPGIVYGWNTPAIAVTLAGEEFSRKLGRVEGSQLIRLTSTTAEELDGKTVLVKDVQVHPVTGSVLHADFYAVDLEKRVRVRAPLHFVGRAAGIVAGGILQPVRREVVVECLPTAIPGYIEIDVSELGIHDTLHIEDVRLPEGVEAVAESNFAIVTVLPPTVEEVPAAEAAPEAAPEGEAPPAAAPAAEESGPTEREG
jgi:large subunit ribosomal protein L25